MTETYYHVCSPYICHQVLQANGMEPIVFGPKEGLAMINGTQFISALGAEGTYYDHIPLVGFCNLQTEIISGTSSSYRTGRKYRSPGGRGRCAQSGSPQRVHSCLRER